MNIITILLIVNVFAAIGIIGLVLMQQSKGDMGSAFGGGGSQSMFGSRGSANFLSRSTSFLTAIFFISSLALAFTYAKRNQSEQEIAPISIEQSSEVPSVEDSVPTTEESSVPSVEDSSVPVIESSSEIPTDEASVPSVEGVQEAVENAVDEEVPATE